jgi:hypothetical protein
MTRNPLIDPLPGDVIETYNEMLGITSLRKVTRRNGCQVFFTVDDNQYIVCVDIFRVMCKNGKILLTK